MQSGVTQLFTKLDVDMGPEPNRIHKKGQVRPNQTDT